MGGRLFSRGRAAALVAAVGHLGLVAMGALGVHPQGDGWLTRSVAYYSALSGAESGYAFFAHSVTPIPMATFHVTDAAGATVIDTLESGMSRETEIRILNMLMPLLRSEDPEIQRSLAASWAGKVLARHPGAESVAVRLVTCDLPPMREYREGKRPGWDLHYEAKFMMRSKQRTARDPKRGAP